ncbi:hypothetical protein [Pararobbsia alpina]|uniref:Uncharacterized protein n=1 Tax=Pararobbsia alpina TaxID=621374 RepID=A0A6S7BCX8_9BURK|nr:hypothetical protein [Pararobbsia alpina]CAB3784569.1 hypothetical protein LMG28138_01835 [Pararobbsia alpina]
MDSMAAFAMGEANRGNERMVFDWEKAARLIAERKPEEASAGLQGDWDCTGDVIFRDGKPYLGGYTYLASTWATPELDMDGDVVPCYRMESEVPDWDESTKWPEQVLPLLTAA